MIISCEQCQTKFNLDENLLQPAGSKVRCSKCTHVFTAYPPALEPAVEEPLDPAPDDDAAAVAPIAAAAGAAAIGVSVADGLSPQDDPPVMDGGGIGAEDIGDSDTGLGDVPDETVGEAADMDLDLDPGDTPAEATGDDDLDLDFDLDLSETPVEAGGSEDDFDVDLDLDLGEAPAEASGGEDDFDLDLDLDLGEAPAEASGGEDDLDLDLDLSDEDLDLTDIEQMVAGQDGAVGEDDAQVSATAGEELDLSDLEDMLDADFSDDREDLPDDLELNLDLEPHADSETPEAMGEIDGEDLDLSDIEDMLAETSEPVAEAGADDFDLDLSDAGDLDVDTLSVDGLDAADTGDDADFDMTMDDDEFDSAVADDDVDYAATVEIAPPTAEEFDELTTDAAAVADDVSQDDGKKKKKEKKVKAKKAGGKAKIGAPVKILVGLLIVAGALYGGFMAMTTMGIEIPFVSDLLKTAPDDPMGNLYLATNGVNSRFVENAATGRLFVITGKVKNGYEDTRLKIRLTGKLYAAGKKMAQVQACYAGNVLSDQDLAALDLDAIKKQLKNQDKARIAPGQMLPFMLVFNNLPENLEEFTVEVTSSIAAQ